MGESTKKRVSETSLERERPEKPLDLDHVLISELGQFGRFQLRSMLLVAIPIAISAFVNEYIFGAAAVRHRCMIPECGEVSKGLTYDQPWVTNAVPIVEDVPVSCERFAPAETGLNGTLNQCPVTLFNQQSRVACEGYVYARENSVVYEFDLGCQEWMRALAGTLSSIGTLLVLPITGFVSDTFGRRAALVLSCFNLSLFGLIKAFSINYPMYLAFQLLQTTLGAGLFSSSYIFAMEMVGPKYRVIAGATVTSMFAMGQVILGSIAWVVQPWRYMIMTLHIPGFLVISYYWLLSESVRWLLSRKKYEEARKVLEKVARVNRTNISEDSLNALTTPPPEPVVENQDEKEPSMVRTIFKSRVLLRRVLTTPVWWITATFVFYGLSINSTSLSDTIYLNYILTCLIEIPGNFTGVLVVDKFGRKMTLATGYLLCAACNIAFAFLPTDLTVLRLVIYLLGKYCIALVFSCLYLFTSELYPTKYRHTLLAFSSMVGRLGSITAPLTPVLADYWAGIPSMMFGTLGLVSGLLVLTQPETLGTKMPDTLAEAEALGKPESKFDRA